MKYNLKSFLVIAILSIAISSCGQKTGDKFPEQLQTSKTKGHVNIPGTKVFALIPSSYKHMKELVRFQKNDDLYIQVIASEGSSFTEGKKNFSREAIEAKGATVDILDNTKLNQYEAIYCEGPSKNPDELKLMLIFGDESFVVVAIGVCKKSDIAGKKELQDILKSLYYDKSLVSDPLELANFEFDSSITGFQHAGTISNSFVYSKNGKADLNNATANMLQFQALPKVTKEKLEELSSEVIRRYEQNGIHLNTTNITKTKINNYPAWVLFTKISYKNKEGILYQTALLGDNSSLLFIGCAYEDLTDFEAKFKKTVETIKLK